MKTPDIILHGINKIGIGCKDIPNPHCRHCAWCGMTEGKSGFNECYAVKGRWSLCVGKDECGLWESEEDDNEQYDKL